MVKEHSDDARDGSMRASPPSVLRGLGDARENAEPGTPGAASEFLRIGRCLQPRFELGRGLGYEGVLPVKDDGGNPAWATACPSQCGGAHFAARALDLVFGCAHNGEAVGKTWEETGCAHPDRWPLVFLDEADAARPLGGRT